MHTFKSKVDSSHLAILGLTCFNSIVFCIFAKSVGSSLFVLGVFIFIIYILFGIKYKIDTNTKNLKISSLFYNSSININMIEVIKKDSSILTAPAASFDGIRITTKHKSVKISPKDQSEFIKLLTKINPNIEMKV